MTILRWAIWSWGVGGVVLTLVQALVRLIPRALELADETLHAGHWVIAVVWCVFMLYVEAWRGFHERFSPRVVVRALEVAREPVLWRVLLAPLVAMGVLYATRRRLAATWALFGGIALLIAFVRWLPEPWRAIVDAGVVLGLLGGTLSIAWFAVQTVRGSPPDVPADMPAS